MSSKVIPLCPSQTIESTISDQALVAACGLGDRAALSQLFRRYHRDIFRFYSRMFGHQYPDLDDLCQKVFFGVWSGASKYKPHSPFRAWLYGIAVNVAKQHRRSERRRFEAFRNFFSTKTQDTQIDPTPHDNLCAKELALRANLALQKLPEHLRVVYILCEIEEMAGTEVATALGARPGTIWRRLHEARKTLKTQIEGGQQ